MLIKTFHISHFHFAFDSAVALSWLLGQLFVRGRARRGKGGGEVVGVMETLLSTHPTPGRSSTAQV